MSDQKVIEDGFNTMASLYLIALANFPNLIYKEYGISMEDDICKSTDKLKAAINAHQKSH